MKTVLVSAIAVCLMAGAAFGFDAAQKDAVRLAVQQVRQRLMTADALDGKAITVLPVRGDEESFAERQLVAALVQSGKTCVIGNDEKDTRFKSILASIRWNERMTTLKAVDPKTVDELGGLKSTQIFLEANLDFAQKKHRSEAELSLLAYAVETKQYVWAVEGSSGAVRGPVDPLLTGSTRGTIVPLNIEIVSRGEGREASSVANLLKAAVVDHVVKERRGVVDSVQKPDVTIVIDTSAKTFDKTGNWIVLEGTTHLSARVVGAEARLLGETDFVARGTRGLGEPAAVQGLATKLAEQVQAWVAATLKPDVVKFEALEFTLKRGEGVAVAADLAPANAVFKALTAMDGVRNVVLKSQDNHGGAFTYRVVYEQAKFPGGFLNTAIQKNAKQFEPFEAR